MSLKDDLEKVPSWVWLGGAAAIGVLWILRAHAGGTTTAADATGTTAPLNTAQQYDIQTQLANIETLLQQSPLNQPPATGSNPIPPTMQPTMPGWELFQYTGSAGSYYIAEQFPGGDRTNAPTHVEEYGGVLTGGLWQEYNADLISYLNHQISAGGPITTTGSWDLGTGQNLVGIGPVNTPLPTRVPLPNPAVAAARR